MALVGNLDNSDSHFFPRHSHRTHREKSSDRFTRKSFIQCEFVYRIINSTNGALDILYTRASNRVMSVLQGDTANLHSPNSDGPGPCSGRAGEKAERPSIVPQHSWRQGSFQVVVNSRAGRGVTFAVAIHQPVKPCPGLCIPPAKCSLLPTFLGIDAGHARVTNHRSGRAEEWIWVNWGKGGA
jgi:hypothetical protein